MTQTDKKWMVPFGLSTVLVFLYLSSAPTTLPDADAGEFILLSKNAGIAHPPGYPLYVLLLRVVASAALFPSLVYQLSLFSIACAVLSAIVLYFVLVRMGISLLCASMSVLVVYSAPGVWRIANTVEPFALNLLLATCVMAVSLELFQNKKRRLLLGFGVMGALFGLGASNHHALVFYGPLALVAMMRAGAGDPWRALKAAGLFVVGLMLGCLPILALFEKNSDVPLTWGPLRGLGGLWHHLLRADYGTFRLAPDSSLSLSAFRYFWTSLPTEMEPLFFCLAVIGFLGMLGALVSRQPRKEFPWFGCMGMATFLLIGLVFFSLCNVDARGTGSVILIRFFHTGYPWLALFLAVGLEAVRVKVPRNFQGASFAAALFFLFVHVQGQWIYCNRAGETFAEVDVRNTFFLLAESHSPVLVTFSDAEVLGALYGQHILGLGKNVVVVQPAMWPRDTYRWAILEKLGLDLHPNPKFQEDWKVAIQATSVDKDIYFSRLADELKQGWPPQLIRRVRLVRWYRNPLPIDESAMVNRDLASFSYGLERPLGGTPLSAWEASLYARYHEWFQAVASRIQKKP